MTVVSTSPIALIAEDNAYIREDTVRRLKQRGISTIPVGSFRQAAEALNLVGDIDVAVLDIHLVGDHTVNDKGGIEIARLLRTTREEMHIVAYSGHFGDDELTNEERRIFDRTFTKGSDLTRKERRALWDEVADKAVRVAENRMAQTMDHQDKLRRLYELEFSRLKVLQDLDFETNEREYTAEGALGLQGYTLRVVTPPSGEIGQPVLVWHNTTEDSDRETWHNLEAYEFPDIYSSNLSFGEAVEDFFVYLVALRDELDQISALGPDERKLLRFCKSVLDVQSNLN
jgi:CheY-like chemotaxis protein